MWYPRKASSRYQKLDPLADALGEIAGAATKKKLRTVSHGPRDLNAEVDEMEADTVTVLTRCQERLAEREEQIEALHIEMEHVRGDNEVFEFHLHDAIAEKNKKNAIENVLKRKLEELRTLNTRLEHAQKEQQWSSEKIIEELQKKVRSLEDQVGVAGVRQKELEEELQRTKEKAEKDLWAVRIKAQEDEKRSLEAHKRAEEKIRQEQENVAVALQRSEQALKDGSEERESLKRQVSKQQQLIWHKNKLEEQVLKEQQRNGQLNREVERIAMDRDQHAARWPREREEGAKLAGALQIQRMVILVQLNILQKRFAETEELIASKRELNLLDLTLEEALAEMDRMRAGTPLCTKLEEIDPIPRPATAVPQLLAGAEVSAEALPDLGRCMVPSAGEQEVLGPEHSGASAAAESFLVGKDLELLGGSWAPARPSSAF